MSKNWEIQPWDGYEYVTIRRTITNEKTGCDHWEHVASVQRMKDARVIAAAPELLEALIELDNAMVETNGYEGREGTFEIVKSAINKAIGI